MKLVIYNHQNGTEIITVNYDEGIGVINTCDKVKTEVTYYGDTRSAMYVSTAPNYILSNKAGNIALSDSPEYPGKEYRVIWTNPESVKAEV